jgi:predicted esterase
MSKRLYPRWCVLNSARNPDTCVLALPGRDQSGFHMAWCYDQEPLNNTLIVGITPEWFEWYPMPNGPHDQSNAVAGQKDGVRTIDQVLKQIERHFGVPAERTALVGFSAGAVMAIQAGATLPYKFAAVVSHAGAILEPDALPPCRDRTVPYFLFHNRDDGIFDWEERFLPMKEALRQNKYRVQTIERPQGRHSMSEKDLKTASTLVARSLEQAVAEGKKRCTPATPKDCSPKGQSSS